MTGSRETPQSPKRRLTHGQNLQARIAALAFLVALSSAHAFASPRDEREAVVAISHGGALMGTAHEGVQSFLGIPFAAAPTGALRFRAPQPPAPWQGPRDAREFGARCIQIQMAAGASGTLGDEDCLFLNVFAPDRERRNLPVLVWIHGGGRRVGDGRRDVSAFVRDTQSIVVSIQYRLDHLAFFAHPALSAEEPSWLASGNYGFLDAILALRWVQREIAAFGGDPQHVTIAGLSGGGTMVCGLLVSPKSAGLFQRAMIQSGGGCWFPTEGIEVGEARGERDAEALGCTDPAAVTECLRAQPASAFFAAGSLVDNPFEAGSPEWSGAQPLLGGRSGHLVDGAVFPRSWPQAFHSGVFQRVPLLISVTQHEGRRVYGELMYEMGAPMLSAAGFPRALQGLLGSKALAAAVVAQRPLRAADAAATSFADLATDAHYTCPHAELATATAAYTATWFYQFRVPGPRRSDRIELGAYHGADTDLLFGTPATDAGQQRAAQRLRAYIAAFMRNGDPNQDALPSWPAWPEHLAFSDTPRPERGLQAESCRIWRALGWKELPTF